jgi:hypothetical protein
MDTPLENLRQAMRSETVPFARLEDIWQAVVDGITRTPPLALEAIGQITDLLRATPIARPSLARRLATDLLGECVLRAVDGQGPMLRFDLGAPGYDPRIHAGIALLNAGREAGEHPTSLAAFEGGRQFWRQNIALAYEMFDRMRRSFGPHNPPFFHQIGACSVRPLADILAHATTAAPALPPWQTRLARQAPHVVVACLDPVYLVRFGPVLVASLHGRTEVVLHLHVATDAPEAVPVSAYPGCNFSFEPAPRCTQPSAWYAGMRLMRMVDFCALYRRPLLFIDADMRFDGDPDGLFARHAAVDVGINWNHAYPSHLPWRTINAQQIYISGSPASLVFAHYAANLFAGLFDPQALSNWWIDQAILTHALHIARIRRDDIRFANNEWGLYSGLRPQR